MYQYFTTINASTSRLYFIHGSNQHYYRQYFQLGSIMATERITHVLVRSGAEITILTILRRELELNYS